MSDGHIYQIDLARGVSYVAFLFRFSRRPQYADIKLKLLVLERNKVCAARKFPNKSNFHLGGSVNFKIAEREDDRDEMESFIYPYGKKSFTTYKAQSVVK